MAPRILYFWIFFLVFFTANITELKRKPLHQTCLRGSQAVTQPLSDHGANADVEDKEQKTPLQLIPQWYTSLKDFHLQKGTEYTFLSEVPSVAKR